MLRVAKLNPDSTSSTIAQVVTIVIVIQGGKSYTIHKN